jgi:hypothetical protein
VPAWSQVWRDRAATSLAFRFSRAILPENASNSCVSLSLPEGLAIKLNIGNPSNMVEMGEVQAAAGIPGIDAVTSEIRQEEDIVPAFEALKGRAEALYVCANPLMNSDRFRINNMALGARLATLPHRPGAMSKLGV